MIIKLYALSDRDERQEMLVDSQMIKAVTRNDDDEFEVLIGDKWVYCIGDPEPIFKMFQRRMIYFNYPQTSN